MTMTNFMRKTGLYSSVFAISILFIIIGEASSYSVPMAFFLLYMALFMGLLKAHR